MKQTRLKNVTLTIGQTVPFSMKAKRDKINLPEADPTDFQEGQIFHVRIKNGVVSLVSDYV